MEPETPQRNVLSSFHLLSQSPVTCPGLCGGEGSNCVGTVELTMSHSPLSAVIMVSESQDKACSRQKPSFPYLSRLLETAPHWGREL